MVRARRAAFWGAPPALLVATPAAAAENAAALPTAAVFGALAVALLALIIAWIALARARRVAQQFDTLLYSVDHALRQVASTSVSSASTIGEMQDAMRGEIETLSRRLAERDERGDADDGDRNVIKLASARPSAPGKERGAPSARKVEAALASAIEAGDIELSLQPIVSVDANAAVGFETFVHLEIDDELAVDVGRLADGAELARAALERLTITSAAEASRRMLGTGGEKSPLHCPVSENLLRDAAELEKTIGFLQLHPPLARLVVLSAPSALLLNANGADRDAIDRLLDTGISFAAEDWDGGVGNIAGLRASHAGFLKLSTDRLLDRTRTRRKAPSGLDIVAAAAEAGIAVIATGVATDEDAVNLLDIGVDIMVGERFSPPKRLRPGMGRVA
ncbi:EAL domain-containing protein [Nitratireductor mangrovi]|uniref:EAL domain-containing protein n=1 Tax=Nitratireductor mangrovi TaxID=2599600 RepID=A0A5B8KV54_9HYPH|nr:EAL domain-containing protein [Nitratireductor mangrovi]QDY99447.2 EAL domain-containing protein [Nitratireductor mangrovi]